MDPKNLAVVAAQRLTPELSFGGKKLREATFWREQVGKNFAWFSAIGIDNEETVGSAENREMGPEQDLRSVRRPSRIVAEGRNFPGMSLSAERGNDE
jgi:hypothetical protein